MALYNRTLRKGMSGADVRSLQLRLNHHHFRCVGGFDGDFGGRTQLAVIRFQDIFGLAQDGVCGPIVQNRLLRGGQVSPHFNIFGDVLYSKGNRDMIVRGALIHYLERLRTAAGGRTVKCISVYRDPYHNRRVGGVWNSQHIYGKAADIKIYGLSPYWTAVLARRVGFSFTKVYRTFTHVDVRYR